MQIATLIDRINKKLAGELLDYEELKVHLDSVIDDINSQLNATFPVFSEFTPTAYPQLFPDYNFFPEKYLRSVVVPGAAFKFYITDEEGAEAAPKYDMEYSKALFLMMRDYSNSVPTQYQAVDTGYLVNEESIEPGISSLFEI